MKYGMEVKPVFSGGTLNENRISMLEFVKTHGGGLPESIEVQLEALIDNDDPTIDCRHRALEMLIMKYKMGV